MSRDKLKENVARITGLQIWQINEYCHEMKILNGDKTTTFSHSDNIENRDVRAKYHYSH